MSALPLLEEHPPALRFVLAGVVPVLFGALTGYFLGVSEGAYLLLSVLSIVGGVGAGFDHVGPGPGARRGLLGGTLFSSSILIAHEIHGAAAEADLPDPAILIVPLFALLGAGFGAFGGWLRARAIGRAGAD